MRILVWGFGNYYRQKEESIPPNSIIAYVSDREESVFGGNCYNKSECSFQFPKNMEQSM